ncbi:Crp/Fnr family transcriptional regulator [Acuticoccus sp. MNP-M23]|uniref:Crp/Fnr family transcriptional regulator n=1 Tax=Acuticoccus sp. MNP-M23 TaxID=3072793 RepID=UPI0028163DC7|nr:Crp/Fnr family transcriptional regulator [Acuticoccus sp. MNP-M23]WMS44117.1 Crp/Fnr family transcriptional regulator [Acuticoccus sp. MNP-M23]
MASMEYPAMPPVCSRCAVRSRSLCAKLDPVELGALNRISRPRSFSAGQIIVTEGDTDVFGNVTSGILCEKKTLPDGREQIVSLLFPADFHGNISATAADTTVQAITSATVCTFDRATFGALADDFPALQHAVSDYAFRALREARDWMLLLGQKSASERVATFMLRLATRQADVGCGHHTAPPLTDGARVEIPITRAQIAAYLGLTIETVSRRLTALREAGIISFDETRLFSIDRLSDLVAAAGGSET